MGQELYCLNKTIDIASYKLQVHVLYLRMGIYAGNSSMVDPNTNLTEVSTSGMKDRVPFHRNVVDP
jgi:hypothetical protein